MRRLLAGLGLLVLGGVPPAWSENDSGFRSQVVPVLKRHCVMCHLPGDEQGGLSLYPDPWAALVNVASTQAPLKLVEPGSPATSYLYVKLLGTQDSVGGTGLRMPIQQPLEAAAVEMIRQWILRGAGQN